MNQNHYFEAAVLTDRFSDDDKQVEPLLEQINDTIDHFSADSAYDETPVYDVIVNHSPTVDVVIPPKSNAVLNDKAAPQRNNNIIEIAARGRMICRKIGSMDVGKFWSLVCSDTSVFLEMRPC